MGCQQTGAQETEPSASNQAPTFNHNEMSEKEQEIVAKMIWVNDADPYVDANAALTAKTPPEIFVFTSRSKSYPGLRPEQYLEISERTKPRYAKGAGDVLYGPNHKALRQKLKTYAKAYNRTVYTGLTGKPIID